MSTSPSLVKTLSFNLMKIKLLSDLHLEFGGMDPGSGDVLILAGDIVNVKEMHEGTPQGKYYLKFLEKCANNYNRVFMVLGNHEFYFGSLDNTASRLKTLIDVKDSNITLLDNECVTYEGVNFIGGTMWTNYDCENEDKMFIGLKAMTDYHVIEQEDGKLLPSTTVKMHKETLEYFNSKLRELDGPTVVITHHAPHPTSLSGDYVDDNLSAAYHSDLNEFIGTHKDNIEVWCHGHIHHTNDYNVAGVRILSNPRGYKNYNENPDFNPDFEWTVGEVAQPKPAEV